MFSNLLPTISPTILAIFLFISTYLVIMTEKINRAIMALIGASLMILCGILTQEAAIRSVDFNTLGLLLGMMVIVNITKRSGIFEYIAILAIQKVRGHPVGILIILFFVTAVFSALLDNVTTVLLIVPVTLSIAKQLQMNPYPYLFSEIFASNIGGTATLIGDPPNIMIGSAAGLNFNDFVFALTPIALVIAFLTLFPIFFIWRKRYQVKESAKLSIMKLNAKESITNLCLLKQSLTVIFGVITGFTVAHSLHLEPATIAIFGAAILLLLDNFKRNPEQQATNVHHIFGEAEWVTLFFFLGLFILVHGIEKVGIIKWLATELLTLTHGDLKMTALLILWGSAILSALIDNIPYVATMIPLIKSMQGTFTEAQLLPIWWALALGACLGGNGSLIGASANLVVAGLAERQGHRFYFLSFLKLAFPLMLLSILCCHIYLEFRYF